MRADVALASAIFLLALGLRVHDVARVPTPVMDEAAHVPAAKHYWNDGHFEPDFWEHPPLRHVMLHGFLHVLGENPYGWRMRNVLFGALAAALTFLFAREIGGDRRAGALAGLLMATDPLHVVMSRFTYEEIYGGAIFLAGILVYLKHRRRSAWLAASALLMGCALATKWYYVPCWLLIGILALREHGAHRDPLTAVFVASTWLLLPAAVYLLAFAPWFGRGYDLGELVEHTVNSYHSLQALNSRSFGSEFLFLAHPSPREWFVLPIVVGEGTLRHAGRGEFTLLMNDVPVWILAIPALVGLCVLAVRRRQLRLALPALFFLASYALLAIVDRPTFVYSAAPLLPFAFTAIAIGATTLVDRLGPRLSNRLYAAIVAAALGWSLFLYPLVTAKEVPVAAYRFLVEREGVRVR